MLIEQEMIPALGHEYSEWISNGNKEHYKVCAHDSEHVVKEACEYEYIVLEEASDEHGEIRKYTCAKCNDSYIVESGMGDVTGDGNVDTSDAQMIFNMFMGII